MGVFKRQRIGKDGKKTAFYYIRYKIKGKQYWESVGKVGIATKAQAEALLAKRKEQLRLGRLEEIGATIPTLYEFAKEYMNYSQYILRKRSWKRDSIALAHAVSFLGRYKLSAISPKDIQDYQSKRIKEGKKPATINRELDVLRNLFNVARERKRFFGENPISRTRKLEAHNQVERILSHDEEDRLLKEAPPWFYPILVTALHTGMRKNEIVSLKWANIDLVSNVVMLEATNTKSKKKRRVPINRDLRPILLNQKALTGNQAYVFLNSHNKPYVSQDSLKKVFASVCKRAQIKGLRFHDLRHTAATRMIEEGAKIVAVSKILGHQDIRTTMRYAHPDESLREAVELLCDRQRGSQKDSHKNLKDDENDT